MNLDDLPPAEVMWEGKFVRALCAAANGNMRAAPTTSARS